MSAQLAEIMDWFENEDFELEAAIAKYEEAMQLLDSMEKYLKTAENKINKLKISANT